MDVSLGADLDLSRGGLKFTWPLTRCFFLKGIRGAPPFDIRFVDVDRDVLFKLLLWSWHWDNKSRVFCLILFSLRNSCSAFTKRDVSSVAISFAFDSFEQRTAWHLSSCFSRRPSCLSIKISFFGRWKESIKLTISTGYCITHSMIIIRSYIIDMMCCYGLYSRMFCLILKNVQRTN